MVKKNQPDQILGQRKKILGNKKFLKGKTEGIALLKHKEEFIEKGKSDNQNYKVLFGIKIWLPKHENFKKGMEKKRLRKPLRQGTKLKAMKYHWNQ